LLYKKQNKLYKNQNLKIVTQHLVFSVFNTQTVRHVLKSLAIFSVHLRKNVLHF